MVSFLPLLVINDNIPSLSLPPSEPCLEESSLSYTGLHWLLNLPIFLTVLYMLHLDLWQRRHFLFF